MEDEQFYRAVQRIKRRIAAAVLAVLVGLAAAAAVLGISLVQKNKLLRECQDQIQFLLQIKRGEGTAAQAAGETAAEQELDATFPYQEEYPQLYVEKLPQATPAAGTIYLTFDDGPSPNTLVLLDILDEYGVKATFFVVGTEVDRYPDVLLQIAQRGHTIGIHTNSHKYSEIYDSVEAYLEDFAAACGKVESITGKAPTLLRFPGGSLNAYNSAICYQLIAEMLRRGYTYYDWNVSAEDASSQGKTRAQIVATVEQQVEKHNFSVVLMHDSAARKTTIEAVEQLIPELLAAGYQFSALDSSVPPITFAYGY